MASAHGLLLLLLGLEQLVGEGDPLSPFLSGERLQPQFLQMSKETHPVPSGRALGEAGGQEAEVRARPAPCLSFPEAPPPSQARSPGPRARPRGGLTWSPRRRRRLGSSMARLSLHRTRPRLRPSARGPAIGQAGQLTRPDPAPPGEPSLEAPPHWASRPCPSRPRPILSPEVNIFQ